MRWTALFIPTLRDEPADAEAISHRLMLRAGLIRQLGAGIYSTLPIGERVLKKIESIVREEMNGIGGQEFSLPKLHPAETWKESGRWEKIGSEMFRLTDRRQAELCLGLSAEEIFTSLARDELRSYRQLPQIWYQIGEKYRDEPRPKGGFLRVREFTMKDSYSFDLDTAGLDRAFEQHSDAYRRIFSRCDVDALRVEASSGVMGGSESCEFMAVSPNGEDWIATCEGCGYAGNLEKARSVPRAVEDPASAALEKFPTPGVRTIEDLTSFAGGAPAERQIKTLVYVVDGKHALFLMRGDHELNEVKVVEATGTTEVRPASGDECQEVLGAHPGSLGAVGVTSLPIYADLALRGRRGMTTGANEDGFHVRYVDLERDISDLQWTDLREAEEGDGCIECGKPLHVSKSIELGHIFKLGLYYSEPMGATVLGRDGAEVPLVMGSYGIGMGRLMAAVIESHYDDAGIIWPVSVAPFEVVVSPIKVSDPEQGRVAEEIYTELGKAGFEVLLDDRDERPGVKFKDADLVGIPFRIVPGPRALAKGCVELFTRATRESVEVPRESVVEELRERIS